MLKKAKQFVAEMQAQAEQNRERVAQFEKERLEAERAELMNMSEKELLANWQSSSTHWTKEDA